MRRLTLRLGEAQAGGPFTPCSGRSFCCPPPVSGGPRPCRTAFCWTGSPVFTNQTGRAGQLLSVAVGDVAGANRFRRFPVP